MYQPKMKLTADQKAILEGRDGPVMAKIMETMVMFGDIFDAPRLVKVTHDDGHLVTSFGIKLLKPLFSTMEQINEAGIKTKGKFTVDPRPIDYKNVKCNLLEKLVFSKIMYAKQEMYEEQLMKAGLKDKNAFTCASYLPEIGNTPKEGDILAWAESSAVVFANSVLGARCNRNSGMLDLFGSIFWIIILSPLLLIIAIAIKIDSRWPVIYKSKRVWTWWKLFTFLKFRTMYTHLSVGYGGKEAEELYKKLINSDANTREWVLPKIENDPRVTKVWRFLRKTSLDELPQLFSVLIGTMSLVWPRPHLENEVEKYQPWQKRLLSIKPWITWYAQVFWRDSLSFDQEAKLDLYYIQNRSLRLDIYVIVWTFGVIFKGR